MFDLSAMRSFRHSPSNTVDKVKPRLNANVQRDSEIESAPNGPRRPSYAQSIFLSSAGTVVSIGLLFVETMVAVRLIQTDDFGHYVLLVVVVEFLIMVVDFGCQTGATKLIASSERGRQEAITASTLIFRAALLGVVSLGIYLARDVLLIFDQSRGVLSYVAYIPMMLIVASFDELLQAILQGFQAYQQMVIARIISSVLRVVLSYAFLAMLHLGALGLIYSWTISFAASALYQYLVLPISKRLHWQRPLMEEILHFGLPLQGIRVLWFASGRISLMLVGAFTGPAGVAYLNVAGRVPNALFRLAQSYVTVYFPVVSELLAKKEGDRARWMLECSLRLLSFALGFGALVGVLFSHEFTILLFSEKYAPSVPVFALLMIELQASVLLSLMGFTLTAAGHPGRSLVQNLLRTVMIVVANLLLIPPLGFLGSAFASLVAVYITIPLCVWYLRRTGIQLTTGSLVKQMTFLWLCVVLFWWLRLAALPYKLALLLLFVALNLVFSTVSVVDLRLVLPDNLTRRLFQPRESRPAMRR